MWLLELCFSKVYSIHNNPFKSLTYHYTLVCLSAWDDGGAIDWISGAVSSLFGSSIGDLDSVDHGSSSWDPLWCTRFALSGNLTDFLEPLLFGDRISGMTDGDGPENMVLLL